MTQSDSSLQRIKKAALTLSIIAISGFVLLKLYPLIHGPDITLATISNGAVVTDGVVHLNGKAAYTKNFLVNGLPLALSPDGSFTDDVLLHPGYNVISISAQDRFGAITHRDYAIVLNDSGSANVAIKYPIK